MSSAARTSRILSLDSLRAFSIVLVMFSHLLGTMRFPLGVHDLCAVGDLGTLGVRVFFVISGFLITSLLLAEHRKTGTVSLRAFYVRRAFRIFPAFYLWQEPFLNHRAHSSMTTWPVNVVLAVGCAGASYYLVETPFFAVRDSSAARRRARAAVTAAPTP